MILLIKKIIDKLKSILEKQKQIQYHKRLSKSKLGVLYNLFDGIELLEKSILQIKNDVDYILIAYQNESWFGGAKQDDNVIEILNSLKNKSIIDDYYIYDYSNDKIKYSGLQGFCRRKKILNGIKLLSKAGCTHVIIMDVDEFYESDKFHKAKEFIIGNGYTHSAVVMHGYFYKPTFRMRDINNTCVPFILKINPFRFISSHGMPCYVDPYRCFNYVRLFDKFYFYTFIYMHHMTRVRKNLNEKFKYADMYNKDASSNKEAEKFVNSINSDLCEDELVKKIESDNNLPMIKVDDYFGLSKELNL